MPLKKIEFEIRFRLLTQFSEGRGFLHIKFKYRIILKRLAKTKKLKKFHQKL